MSDANLSKNLRSAKKKKEDEFVTIIKYIIKHLLLAISSIHKNQIAHQNLDDTSIIIDIPRNFNSPIGDIPWDSINILNIGPLIGRKNNTNKTPIFCLRPINIRVGTHFSNHSVHRIDLGMICAR